MLMNAFFSIVLPLPLLPRRLVVPDVESGVALTRVYKRVEVVLRPNREPRNVHFNDCFNTGRSMTWMGSGAVAELDAAGIAGIEVGIA